MSDKKFFKTDIAGYRFSIARFGFVRKNMVQICASSLKNIHFSSNRTVRSILSSEINLVYALPIILRITNEIPVTGTFKIQKSKVQKQGWNPATLPESDELFVLQRSGYEKLDSTTYQKIQAKQLKF